MDFFDRNGRATAYASDGEHIFELEWTAIGFHRR